MVYGDPVWSFAPPPPPSATTHWYQSPQTIAGIGQNVRSHARVNSTRKDYLLFVRDGPSYEFSLERLHWVRGWKEHELVNFTSTVHIISTSDNTTLLIA